MNTKKILKFWKKRELKKMKLLIIKQKMKKQIQLTRNMKASKLMINLMMLERKRRIRKLL